MVWARYKILIRISKLLTHFQGLIYVHIFIHQGKQNGIGNKSDFVEKIRKALYASKIVSYAQVSFWKIYIGSWFSNLGDLNPYWYDFF